VEKPNHAGVYEEKIEKNMVIVGQEKDFIEYGLICLKDATVKIINFIIVMVVEASKFVKNGRTILCLKPGP